jgi:hypothetical protein
VWTERQGVLLRRCGDSAETGGDLWLEYKGRRRVAGPEELSGRNDLFATLQQSSNAYQDGRCGRQAPCWRC